MKKVKVKSTIKIDGFLYMIKGRVANIEMLNKNGKYETIRFVIEKSTISYPVATKIVLFKIKMQKTNSLINSVIFFTINSFYCFIIKLYHIIYYIATFFYILNL